MSRININLKRIGTLVNRGVSEIHDSNWTLGCETLDRDFADYEQYKAYIPPLGIKTIRLQGGWAKTEKTPGHYDFAWLDRIIDDARSRGLNILLETGYGNPVYPGGGGFDLGAGFPNSPEGIRAWDNWVEAMARHFRGRVRDWAMWNEPDVAGIHSPDEIVAINVRTAEIIRRIIPDARIAGLSLANPDAGLFEEYIRRFRDQGKLELFDWFIYHGYNYNPDHACDSGNALRRILKKYQVRAKLRQGENGCPSENPKGFALANWPWSEFTQSKWDLRRYIGDLGNDVESAVFTICDFNHIGREINRKGLLLADAEHRVIRPKMAYHAIQNMTTIFDDRLERISGAGSVVFPRESSCYTFRRTDGSGNLLVAWDRSEIPSESAETPPAQVCGLRFDFEEPVVVEMISGDVFELPSERMVRHGEFTILKDLPLTDSPIVVAERKLLPIC